MQVYPSVMGPLRRVQLIKLLDTELQQLRVAESNQAPRLVILGIPDPPTSTAPRTRGDILAELRAQRRDGEQPDLLSLADHTIRTHIAYYWLGRPQPGERLADKPKVPPGLKAFWMNPEVQ